MGKDVISIDIPMAFKKRGGRRIIVLPDGTHGHPMPAATIDNAMVKAIARASKLEWKALQCEVEGVLDRVNSVTQFTRYDIHAKLWIAGDVDEQKARHILEKSEAVCLITNSLKGEKQLHAEVIIS